MLRVGARRGGTVVSIYRRARKVKRRRLVLIADISGSMELYTRLLLQLFHGVAQRLGDTETFVFGTRLTRVTALLRLRDVDRALEEVSSEVVDFAGGTRIGASLTQFCRGWGGRVLRRGAVVILVSDGLDTGDPQLLERAVRGIRGRCHRLIWLNPLLGDRRYEPRTEGMVAALRHVDDFMPVHNVQSLQALAAHLAGIPERRGASPAERAPGPRESRVNEAQR